MLNYVNIFNVNWLFWKKKHISAFPQVKSNQNNSFLIETYLPFICFKFFNEKLCFLIMFQEYGEAIINI